MNKRLYVGNLPYTTSESELSAAFGAVGPVTDTSIPRDPYDGRSKGFGFVEMASEDLAQTAIERLNDTDLGGRRIRVAEARPRRSRASQRDVDRSWSTSTRW